MFGHQNDVITQDQQADADVPLEDSAVDALTSAPIEHPATDDHALSTPAPLDDQDAQQPSAFAGFVPPDPHPTLGNSDTDQHESYLDDQPAEPVVHGDVIQPDVPTEHSEPADEHHLLSEDDDQPAPYLSDDHGPAPDADKLLQIKQDALQSLSPLVGNLELDAQDKFRTLMMMIQASDNQSLIPNAYEAAKAITDEKARAQALLDIVNEINYFTQKDDQK